MKKQWMMAVLFTGVAVATSQAALTWTGAADGASLYNETNWLDHAGSIPAADTINPGEPITADTGGLIEINSGTGTPDAFGDHFRTGVGNAINIGGGKTLASINTAGMGQDTAFDNPLVDATLTNGATVYVQFAVNYAFVLDGGSTLRFKGGGNPLNVATVDLVDTNSVLQFDAETLADFINEHASNVTVNGEPIEIGINAVSSAFNGANGVQIQAIEPVPDSPPVINSFSVNNTNVLPGTEVTLAWDVILSESLTIDQGIGDVTGMDSIAVTVNADTTYTLIAFNGNGATTNSVSVTLITTDPAINAFAASKTIVSVGETVTLSWNVDDATGLSIDQGVGDVTGTSSVQVDIFADTTYTLTASNVNGDSTETVSIVIGDTGGLLAHYTFDVDGTATIGADAVLGAAASIDALDPVIGVGALALSGAPDPETTGNDGAVSGNVFDWSSDDTRTVAFWMKTTAGDVGDVYPTMISLGSGVGGGDRFDIRLDGDALRLEVQGGGSTTTSTNLVDGVWHHVAVVVPSDGATVSSVLYYIDGLYVANFDNGQNVNTGTGPLRMGDSYHGLTRDFKGSLDDVRLYETALTAEEILALATIVQDPGEQVADLAISGPVAGGSGMVLSWTGEDGKPYGVETNSNLIIPDWQTFMTGLVGDGGTITVTNTIGPDQTFYRVISEQPE